MCDPPRLLDKLATSLNLPVISREVRRLFENSRLIHDRECMDLLLDRNRSGHARVESLKRQ